MSSSSRLCFLQTKNRRGDLHASRHSTNVSVLVLLSASHCGCHSDFPKAVLICGGCSKCALLPWGCPCAAHCHNAWLCCREVQMPALLAKRETATSETLLTESQLCLRVENLPLPMSFKVPVTENKPLFIPMFV